MYTLINESVNGPGQATIAQTATGRAGLCNVKNKRAGPGRAGPGQDI